MFETVDQEVSDPRLTPDQLLKQLESIESGNERLKQLRKVITSAEIYEDKRFTIPRGADGKPDWESNAYYLNEQPVDPLKCFESTSWSPHSPYNQAETWQSYYDRVQTALSQDTDYEALAALEDAFNQEVVYSLLEITPEFIEVLLEKTGMEPEGILMAGSGSEVLLAVWELYGSANAVITDENGSDIVKTLRSKLKALEVTIRDGLNLVKKPERIIKSMSNALFGKERANAEATEEIAEPQFCQYVLVPKTGADLSGQVATLAQEVAEFNAKPENAAKQKVLVIDAIQWLGRKDPQVLGELLKLDGVAGIVITGSKAPNGPPHAGFYLESAYGASLTKAKSVDQLEQPADWLYEKPSESEAQFSEEVDPQQTAEVPGQSAPETIKRWSRLGLPRLLRVKGNLEAIKDTLESETTLYGKEAKEANHFISQYFESQGFHLAHQDPESEMPSMVTIELFGFTRKTINEIGEETAVTVPIEPILNQLAREHGILLGGPIMNKGRALLRFGLSRPLIDHIKQNPDSWQAALEANLDIIAAAFSEYRSQPNPGELPLNLNNEDATQPVITQPRRANV